MHGHSRVQNVVFCPDSQTCSACREANRKRTQDDRKKKRRYLLEETPKESEVRRQYNSFVDPCDGQVWTTRLNQPLDVRGFDATFWRRLWYYHGKFGWHRAYHVHTDQSKTESKEMWDARFSGMANKVMRWDNQTSQHVPNELRIIFLDSTRRETGLEAMVRLYDWLARKGGYLLNSHCKNCPEYPVSSGY